VLGTSGRGAAGGSPRRHAGIRVGDPALTRSTRSRTPAPTRSSRRGRNAIARNAITGDPDRQGVTGRPAPARRGMGRTDGRPHHLPVGRARRQLAGGCSPQTTSSTLTDRSSRSRATCGIRPTRSCGGSTRTPTSTRRGR
jgi:hypothetical protein